MPENKVMPVRIQRKRTKGYDMQKASPNGLQVVYVGRNSVWGNPYRVGYPSHDYPPHILMARDCIELFEYYTVPELIEGGLLEELRRKNLACWCKIGEPCHADVLLRLANQ